MKTFYKTVMFDLILMFFLSGIPCISQDSIYLLHPVNREILGMNEINYSPLFQEISIVKFEVWLERKNIKMAAEYPSLYKTCTSIEPGKALKSFVIKDSNSYQINNQLLGPDIYERLKFEYIYNERAQEMINYNKIRKQGIDPCPLYLDFSRWKKKT